MELFRFNSVDIFPGTTGRLAPEPEADTVRWDPSRNTRHQVGLFILIISVADQEFLKPGTPTAEGVAPTYYWTR